MMRGTHQVGAFAASLGFLAFVVPTLGVSIWAHRLLDPLAFAAVTPPVNGGSLLAFLVAGLLGGTAPDLDKPRRWWARFLAHTAFGGHRHLSHSLVGLILAVAAFGFLARNLGSPVGISSTLVTAGFVAGYLSHLILDSLTIEGVPWFFPLPAYLGFPPASNYRVRTGSLVEQFVVMPLLLAGIGWIGYRAGGELLRWWS